MPVARGLLGIVVLIGLAWLLSSDRRRFPWKLVISGLILQWVLAWIVLRTATGEAIFDGIGRVVTTILYGADEGAKFVFGPLAGSHPDVAWTAIAGIKITTTIIIVATLSAVGYHYGILQRAVGGMAWIMKRTMGVSGAESLAGAANVFFGQTEAPLLVRPYISHMTQSELMALMTGGFATVAAGVMAVYVGILSGDDAELGVRTARHLLTACLMSAPAAFVMAKVMLPERQTPETAGSAKVGLERETKSLVDAITHGASQGMKLAINVLAMLIAFIALIAIVDAALIALGNWSVIAPAVRWLGLEQLDLDGILGLLFSPVAWLIGVDGSDCRTFGSLLGKAMAANELIAYGQLGEAVKSGAMSERSILLATYSLCGFANFSSIGIQIGGIGGLAPDRRDDLVRLGPRAMLGGAMACWTTGCIAGVLAR
jgi:CNT family concentrative nucleoside transporter